MLPGEAAGAPCRQQSRAQPPGARPGRPAAPARAASSPGALARWNHSAIKRPLGERLHRAQETGPGLLAPPALGEGLEQGLGLPSCHSRPAGRSLQTDTSCPGAPHNPGLARSRLPWKMLGGLLLQSQTHPLLQQLAPSYKGLFPKKSGARAKGRSDGQQAHPQGLCRDTQPQ